MLPDLLAPGTSPKDYITVNISVTKEVELRNFPMPVSIHFYRMESRPGWWKLSVHIESPDRDTADHGYWGIETYFNGEPTLTERADETRRMVKEILSHEVDENLYVNGVRRYDPHLVCDSSAGSEVDALVCQP